MAKEGVLNAEIRKVPPKSGVIWKKQNNPLPKDYYQNTEVVSYPSQTSKVFEDLSHQIRQLDQEEEEINNQRKLILQEKDRIAKQLRRLEAKERIAEREVQMRKQRELLEIEKKKLQEDIAELDELKEMLESKKNDTKTGFDDLAESNKEMRSMKSGDLYGREAYSRASQRSKLYSKNGPVSSQFAGENNNISAAEINKINITGLLNNTMYNRPPMLSAEQKARIQTDMKKYQKISGIHQEYVNLETRNNFQS